MNLNEQLQQLISAGATITLFYGYGPTEPMGLAAANYQPGKFAWCELFPQDQSAAHLMPCDAELLPDKMILLTVDDNPCGVIAAMEDDEPKDMGWAEWQMDRWDAARDFAQAEVMKLQEGGAE